MTEKEKQLVRGNTERREVRLLEYFWEVASMCNELDIYEHEELDESLHEAQEWVKKNYGR